MVKSHRERELGIKYQLEQREVTARTMMPGAIAGTAAGSAMMICKSHLLGASMASSPDEELSPSPSPEGNRVATPAKTADRRVMHSYWSTAILDLWHTLRLTT